MVILTENVAVALPIIHPCIYNTTRSFHGDGDRGGEIDRSYDADATRRAGCAYPLR